MGLSLGWLNQLGPELGHGLAWALRMIIFQTIENALQRLLHVETLHPDHAVPELE
jgi:hypothetical protein